MKISINKIHLLNKEENEYCIMIENNLVEIKKLNFKEVYLTFLNTKPEIKEWETRMSNYLQTNEINWEKEWLKLHDSINNPYVKSSLWEMHHLNFWSGYRAKERCSLCKELEQDITHILNNCSILKEILRTFNIHNKCDTKMNITFGMDKEPLTNFILYHIKSVVFRSRFTAFPSKEVCKVSLISKCRQNIKKDLRIRFNLAKLKGKIEEFTSRFMQNSTPNSLEVCVFNNNNELEFTW